MLRSSPRSACPGAGRLVPAEAALVTAQHAAEDRSPASGRGPALLSTAAPLPLGSARCSSPLVSPSQQRARGRTTRAGSDWARSHLVPAAGAEV